MIQCAPMKFKHAPNAHMRRRGSIHSYTRHPLIALIAIIARAIIDERSRPLVARFVRVELFARDCCITTVTEFALSTRPLSALDCFLMAYDGRR